MTNLEEMLVRAAETEPVGFGAEEVRRRVRRRARARRAATALVVVPVLAAVGLWGAATVTDDQAERVEVADDGGGAGIDGGLVGRWTPIAYSAVAVGGERAYIEFGEAGSLAGDDGCTRFTASWSVTGGRLLVEGFEEGPDDCELASDTMLIEILRDGPTIEPSGFAAGSLQLRSPRGFVAFERAGRDPDGTSTTTEPEPSAEPTVTNQTGDVPARWVGKDRDHRLVVVDTGSGEVMRVLETFDDPDDFGEETGEPIAAGSFLGDFTVSPDGRTVYWELCCEPAPGAIFRAPIDGGEPEFVTLGAFPALSPDGSRLAVVELQWITVIDLSSGDARRFMRAGDDPVALANPTWSPDGRTLAFEQYDDDLERGRIMALDTRAATSLDDARQLGRVDATGTPMLPTFDRAGRLHVVQQGASTEPAGDPSGPAVAVVLDPATGEVQSQRSLDAAVSAQHHDPSGSYLLRTFIDGSVEYRTLDGEPMTLATGYLAASW